MKKTVTTILSAAVLMMLTACGDSSNKEDAKEVASEQNEQKFEDTKMEDDTEFAVAAANGGMLEVELGRLAQSNGSSPKVKELGRMMADDHSKANEELKALAQQKNITLPAALSDESRKKVEDLTAKKGKDFDEAYTDFMVSDHKEDIEDFKEAANEARDADIKAWAAGKVPVLQHHLEMAQAARDALK